jgi:hypothetical protein
MNTTAVLSLLEANRNDPGIENWAKLGLSTSEEADPASIGLTT